jgi:LysM repeat protein
MNRTRILPRVLGVLALTAVLTLALIVCGKLSTAAAESSTVHVAAAPYAQVITYTVQPGDTLHKIAIKFGVTVSALVALNDIQDPNLIEVGQVLEIPESSTTATPAPSPTSQSPATASTTTYVVQPGDTLHEIAAKFGVTVNALVRINNIQDPNLIEVGQVLKIPAPTTSTPTPATPAPSPTPGGPLTFTWALVSWVPADPNYIATIHINATGGTPPYTYYNDNLVQPGASFELAWRRCRPKPGSIGVSDATGAKVTMQYWLIAPYCPVGVEITQPEADAVLTHVPHDFNVRWKATVDPPPEEFGMEIEIYQDGDWIDWNTYEHFGGDLFLVTGFPGDTPGRLRMWGIYEKLFPGPKTDWRHFRFASP